VLGNPFRAEGRWYKSALHVHTTDSDGDLSPSDTVRFYADRGFDLVCITDHGGSETLPDPPPETIVFPGAEVGSGNGHHIVALGLERPGRYSEPEDIDGLFDRARNREIVLVLAHPNWSRLKLPEMTALDAVAGVEVYNTTCDLGRARGLSDAHWDDCLDVGRCLWAVAVDDTHHIPKDAARGWTMLKLPEPTREALVQALLDGAFYASTGVTIHRLDVEESRISVVCDPVLRIDFLTGRANLGRSFFCEGSFYLTEAAFDLPGNLTDWVRVQCVAPDGRRAWSNPFKCENGKIVEWPSRPDEWRKESG